MGPNFDPKRRRNFDRCVVVETLTLGDQSLIRYGVENCDPRRSNLSFDLMGIRNLDLKRSKFDPMRRRSFDPTRSTVDKL